MMREDIFRLPQEIIEEILARLPVKSLLRLRCVSKSWCYLIGSKRFIKTHLQKSTENASLCHHRIIVEPVRTTTSIYNPINWIVSPITGFHHWNIVGPNRGNVEWNSIADLMNIECIVVINIVGCCDGLVCILVEPNIFFHVKPKTFILWNPSTKMCKKLPNAWNGVHPYDPYVIYGLGYDESSDDYKVIVGIDHISRVYSLNANSWKTLEGDYTFGLGRAGTLASGNLHWNRGTDGQNILSFDLNKEVFGMVDRPSLDTRSQTLGVIQGRLGLLCNYPADSRLDVWVMEEYGVKESWVKLFTLPNLSHPTRGTETMKSGSAALASFCRELNGEGVLIFESVIIIYSVEDGVFRVSWKIDVVDADVTGVDAPVESLVLLASDEQQPLLN